MITETDLYDFYYISGVISPTVLSNDFNRFIIVDRLGNLKKKYLETFSHLLHRQLSKYSELGRVDSDFKIPNKTDVTGIHESMGKTYRTDMNRRNKEWLFLSEWVAKLANSQTFSDQIIAIDRINNAIHNTGENIFSKISRPLISTLDAIHSMKNLRGLRNKCSSDVRKLEI